MENHNDGQETGMGPDIEILNSDLHIVQDIEEDLEAYTRLNRLGRFGEAFRLFRETLHRHLGCFAVLAEHCNALIYQGNYGHASLVLYDSIARQQALTTGLTPFKPSEMHFLRLTSTYVNLLSERQTYTGPPWAVNATSQARWYRDTISATGPLELMDVERQILLTCLRIFIMFMREGFASIGDLHLPWSSRPSYPGQILNLSGDYLAWFEVLLPDHPWDACIVLQVIGYLQSNDDAPLEWSIIMDMVERTFPDSELADVNTFARMLLLGKLCEIALAKRWCMPGLSDGAYDLDMTQIVVDPESERLAELIRSIIRQYSGAEDVTETRPYRYLQLLIIDHEMIREHKAEDARNAVSKTLITLGAIEKYAASSETFDHQLAMDVINHQYIFQPRKDWRKIMLNKIAHFTSRFGKTQESLRLHSSIFDNTDLFSKKCHPGRNDTVAQIIMFSELIKDVKDFRSGRQVNYKLSKTNQSIFESVLQNLGDQEPEEVYPRAKIEEHVTQSYPSTQIPSYPHIPDYSKNYIPSYNNPYIPSYDTPYIPSYNIPNPFMNQPRPATDSKWRDVAPSYSKPTVASTHPDSGFYELPQSEQQRSMRGHDPRFIASTEANPDTIQLPARPKEKAKSSMRARVESYSSYDERGDSTE